MSHQVSDCVRRKGSICRTLSIEDRAEQKELKPEAFTQCNKQTLKPKARH